MTAVFATRAATGLVRALAAALLLALTPTLAAAQNGEALGETGQSGAPGVNSTISWETDYQDNVFRTAEHSVSDIVSTLSASAGAHGQVKRLEVRATGAAEWVHFDTFVKERGANAGTSIRANLLFNRVAPYLSTSYRNSRRRTNPEIDIRPRIIETTFAAGSVFRVGGKTLLDLSAEHRIEAYDGIVDDGVNLSDALNTASNQVTVSLRHGITPLTRVTVTGQAQRREYDTSSYRSADHVRLMTGFESQGRIRGHALAGIQVVKPHDPGLPEMRGPFMSVGTSAMVGDRLQIGLNADRGAAPSYRASFAYYDSQGYGGSIAYAMGPSLRLSAMAHRRLADYRDAIGTSESAAEHAGVEKETRYSSGVSYQLGQALAINFAGAYTERSAIPVTRRFDHLSFTVGVSHVF